MHWKRIARTLKGELRHLQENNGPHSAEGTLAVLSPQGDLPASSRFNRKTVWAALWSSSGEGTKWGVRHPSDLLRRSCSPLALWIIKYCSFLKEYQLQAAPEVTLEQQRSQDSFRTSAWRERGSEKPTVNFRHLCQYHHHAGHCLCWDRNNQPHQAAVWDGGWLSSCLHYCPHHAPILSVLQSPSCSSSSIAIPILNIGSEAKDAFPYLLLPP